MRSYTAQANHADVKSHTVCQLIISVYTEVTRQKREERRKIATQGSHAASSFAVQGEAPRQASAPVQAFLDVNCREADESVK